MVNVKSKVKEFFNKYPVKNFNRGEVILSPDQGNRAIFFLQTGYVKQYSVSKDGRIKAVNIFKPGAFFPIILALAKFDNKFYFEAIGKVTVYKAPVGEVLKLIINDNQIIADLCRRFMIGVDGILNILQSIMYETSRKKLASFILMLWYRFGSSSNNNYRIDIPLTHQDIASFTGMIRETVSFEMKKLQKEGIIADNKRRRAIQILDYIGLQKILTQ